MMRLSLQCPHVLRRSGAVEVYDADGSPFYFMAMGSGRFTLPAGDYSVSSPAPVHVLGTMPVRPFDPGAPIHPLKPIRVRVKPNGAKASIQMATGEVTVDPWVMEQARFVRDFIILHEVGHYYHDSETGADSYAAGRMFQEGYNPSQVDAAARFALSGRSGGRVCNVELISRAFDGQLY